MDHRDPRTGGEITDTYHMAMETAVGTGELRRARSVAELVARNEVGRTIAFLTTSRMVIPLRFMGEFDAALAEADAMRAAWSAPVGPSPVGWVPRRGRPRSCTDCAANEHYAEWVAYARRLSQHVHGPASFVEARVALHDGRLDDARAALRDADGIRDFFDPYAVSLRAEVAVVVGARTRAILSHGRTRRLRRTTGRGHASRRGDASGDDAGAPRRGRRLRTHRCPVEWATTALLLDDLAEQGHAVLTELGCSSDLPVGD